MAPSRTAFLLLAAALALAAPSTPVRAQPAGAAPQITDAVAGELGRLRELTDAKTYAPALALIDRLLPATGAESYDRTLLSQIKAQIFLTEGRYAEAIAPLEDALHIGERHGYLPEATRLELLFLLAQLNQQQGAEAKDPSRQRALLERAATYVRHWQAISPRPTPQVQLFAASLFYQQATLNSDKADPALLAAAQHEAREGLLLELRPNNNLYILLLAAHQQREEHEQAAEILELLVEKNPSNASYWQQLVSSYLTLAGAGKNPREADRLTLRAMLAVERAQALGLLTSPKEHFNLAILHLNLRRFDTAAEILESGLADGRIENTRRNWELLASTRQQAGDDARALSTLEKAIAALPAEGQLEFNLAQLLYARTRPAEARRHLERAVEKGRLDKPGQARLFLAYTAFELQDHDAAARWVAEAARFDDVKKDDVTRLAKAIDEAARPRKDDATKT